MKRHELLIQAKQLLDLSNDAHEWHARLGFPFHLPRLTTRDALDPGALDRLIGAIDRWRKTHASKRPTFVAHVAARLGPEWSACTSGRLHACLRAEAGDWWTRFGWPNVCDCADGPHTLLQGGPAGYACAHRVARG